MNEVVFDKTEKTFFSIYSGKFDTPKRLNRSSKKISPSVIEDIEAGKITSESIKSLSKSLPIFVYKTCLTIHGNFPEILRERIGGYKNLIQNNNGSLEVRYNAIDHELKNEIEKYCIREFRRNRTSVQDNFTQTFTTTDKQEAINKVTSLKAKWETFKFTGMKARVSIQGNYIWGMYYIFLVITPLLIDGNPLSIAMQMTDLSEKEIMDYISEKEKEKAAYNAKVAQMKLEREQKKELAEQQLSKFERKTIEAVEGNIYIRTALLNNGDFGFVLYKVIRKGSFGRVVISRYFSNILPTVIEHDKFSLYAKGKEIKLKEITAGAYLFSNVVKNEGVKEIIKVPINIQAHVKAGDIKIIDYSDKAIAVIGDTKPIKDSLKSLGGRFNFRLTCGAGWIFPKTKKEKVQNLIATI